MPQVILSEADDSEVQDIPADVWQHVQQALAAAGLPDPTGQWAGVVFKAAFRPDYEQRIARAARAGPEWQAVAKVYQSLNTEESSSAPTPVPVQAPLPQQRQPEQAPPSPAPVQARPQGQGLAALLASLMGAQGGQGGPAMPQQQRRRIPQQNPTGLAALVGGYLGRGG